MFSKNIVLSDAFLSLPPSAQALYYLFGMNCDDDGVVPNPIALMKMGKYKKSDYQNLLDKRYILEDEESKVAIIKHHKLNNTIPKDRYKPSTYQEELGKLTVNEYGAYTEKSIKKSSKSRKVDGKSCIQGKGKPVSTFRNPMDTQVKLNKDKLNKDKVVEDENKEIEDKKDMQQQSHASVYKKLEKIFPEASSMWVVAIDMYLDKLSDDLIINAIQETASSGVNNPKYFKAICERYILNGYKTIKDIKSQSSKTSKKIDRKEFNKLFLNSIKKKQAKQMSREEYNKRLSEGSLKTKIDSS